MTIEFRYKEDATTLVDGREKIIVLMQEWKMPVNPFLALHKEGKVFGDEGGQGAAIYHAEQVLGIEAATRRGSPPTESGIQYGNGLSTKKKTLEVTEPFELKDGKGIATSRSDVAQMGGIDFAPLAAIKSLRVLKKAEIQEDQDQLFTENANARQLNASILGNYLEWRKEIHNVVADYLVIDPANTRWSNPTAFTYFDSKTYGFDKSEIYIYMNPLDESNLALALQGSGLSVGDMVYREFITGSVPMINGVPLIVTKWVPQGKVLISVSGTLLVPDKDVIYTLVKTSETKKGDLVTYAKHYYNSISMFDELHTIVTLGTLTKSQQKELDKQAKIEADKIRAAEVKAIASKTIAQEKAESDKEAEEKAELERKIAEDFEIKAQEKVAEKLKAEALLKEEKDLEEAKAELLKLQNKK